MSQKSYTKEEALKEFRSLNRLYLCANCGRYFLIEFERVCSKKCMKEYLEEI